MTKVKSYFFSAVNIIVPVIYLITNVIFCKTLPDLFETLTDLLMLFPFTLLFGLILGGIVPFVMTLVMKLDTSEGFGVRCIYFAISAAACVLSWVLSYQWLAPLIVPIICVIIYGFVLHEFCFDMGLDTPISGAKYVIMLVSNPLMLYIGLLSDLVLDLMVNGLHINIPG